MPHFLNFDQMRESAFVLLHLALGSSAACTINAVKHVDRDEGGENWSYYAGMLKSLVSEIIIQNATRSRIIEDTLRNLNEDDEEGGSIDLAAISLKALNGGIAARFVDTGVSLSLREINNKIIHATDTRLGWSEDKRTEYVYWTGHVMLFGQQGSKDWSVELSALEYARVLIRWLDGLDAEVDWPRLYKYDE